MTITPEPTIVNHEAAASTLMATVRDLVQSGIPGFALAAKGRRRKINTTASLSDPFLEAAAAACGVHADLVSAGQVTAAELRDTIAFSRVYASVAEELRILARGVDDTVAELRNNVGQRALRVYHVASRINRPEERELLIPHLAAMQRTLNRGRSASAKKLAAARAQGAAAALAAANLAPPTSTAQATAPTAAAPVPPAAPSPTKAS